MLVILVSSCAKPVKLQDISAINISDYVSGLHNDQNVIESIKGIALVRISSPSNKVSFRQATIVQSPDLMRLEAYSVLGRTEAVVISDGSRVGLKLAGKRWILYDIDNFDFSLFYKMLPIRISLNQLNSFLLGKIPDYVFNSEFNLTGDKKEGLLIFSSSDGDSKLFVNNDYRRIVKAMFTLDSGERVKVNYDDFIQINPDIYFPARMEMIYNEYSIYVKYDNDIDINQRIDQSLYTINQ